MTSIFERIVTGYDVESWVMNSQRRWFGTYLSEVERQHGMDAGTLQRPRSYVIAPSFDKWPEDQLPAIMVVSIGLGDVPRKTGEGRYRAQWDFVVGCVCSARTQSESRLAAMFYGAAQRALLIQKPSLDGVASGLDWIDESYTELDFDDTRSLSATAARFRVQVDDVTTTKAGPPVAAPPLDPDTLPWPDWPTVQTVDIETQLIH